MIISTYLVSTDPWVLPNPADLARYGDTMPFNEVEIMYEVVQVATLSSLEEGCSSSDPFFVIFTSDESIMEAMKIGDTSWK